MKTLYYRNTNQAFMYERKKQHKKKKEEKKDSMNPLTM